MLSFCFLHEEMVTLALLLSLLSYIFLQQFNLSFRNDMNIRNGKSMTIRKYADLVHIPRRSS